MFIKSDLSVFQWKNGPLCVSHHGKITWLIAAFVCAVTLMFPVGKTQARTVFPEPQNCQFLVHRPLQVGGRVDSRVKISAHARAVFNDFIQSGGQGRVYTLNNRLEHKRLSRRTRELGFFESAFMVITQLPQRANTYSSIAFVRDERALTQVRRMQDGLRLILVGTEVINSNGTYEAASIFARDVEPERASDLSEFLRCTGGVTANPKSHKETTEAMKLTAASDRWTLFHEGVHLQDARSGFMRRMRQRLDTLSVGDIQVPTAASEFMLEQRAYIQTLQMAAAEQYEGHTEYQVTVTDNDGHIRTQVTRTSLSQMQSDLSSFTTSVLMGMTVEVGQWLRTLVDCENTVAQCRTNKEIALQLIDESTIHYRGEIPFDFGPGYFTEFLNNWVYRRRVPESGPRHGSVSR